MKPVCRWLATALLALSAFAASAQVWPVDKTLSGNAFLPPGLAKLQADTLNSPVTLWLDKGAALWADTSAGPSCQSCHGNVDAMKKSAPSFPRLTKGAATGGAALINLEDQIMACRERGGRGGRNGAQAVDDDVLALSAVLHHAAKGEPIKVQAPADQAKQWQDRLSRGAELFNTRLGRINLACVHCHEQNVGRQMRVDVVSPGHPTGFPIYRMSWQQLGTVERRLRACYSGVQAVLPPPGHADLRDLELYLKVRASGMPLDGPSIRR